MTDSGAKAVFHHDSGRRTVSAPGIDVACAGGSDNTEVLIADGTAISSATVAGLAAYVLSLRMPEELAKYEIKNTAKDTKEILMSLAYPRVPDAPPVIWNGKNAAQVEIQRDGGSPVQIPAA